MNNPTNLEDIINSVTGLTNEALRKLRTHVDGLIRQGRENEDDPSQAHES